MFKVRFPISVPCPWCGRGETLADKAAEIHISCQCNRCGNYYHVDFNSLRAARAGPRPKTTTGRRLSRNN